MEWLVFVHVASAIIGIGPAFFMHVCYRKNQTTGDLRHSMGTAKKLELYPKIGGTVAVLSGILLVVWSSWEFGDFWIWGSLVLYVLIQVIVIAFATPIANRINKWLKETAEPGENVLPEHVNKWVGRAGWWLNAGSALGIALIALMVIKPMI